VIPPLTLVQVRLDLALLVLFILVSFLSSFFYRL
jgi:YggT family protein